MKERVLRYGPDETRFGVLTEPSSRPLSSDAPAILWLNAGLLHHVGPFGWYVSLARRMAEQGMLNFRFDLSGIGDNPPPAQGCSLESAIVDVVEAMNTLAHKRQVRRFVLIGLCSGAVLAHHAAARDERVAGAVLLDGYGYPTIGYYLRHYVKRVFWPHCWLAAGRRVFRILLKRRLREKPGSLLSESFFFDFPPREQARSELTQLLQRGTRFLFLYTGGVADHYFNHRRQFAEMFGPLGRADDRVEVEYASEADHLFSAHSHRQAMFERVESWLKRSF